MQLIGFLKTSLLIAGVITIQTNMYDIHIDTMEGTDKPMSDFAGKNILVIVLPITHSSDDTVFLHTIDSMSIRYGNLVNIIGVPAYEDGYTDDSAANYLQYYRSILGSQVTVTGGMYTRKESASQHVLFQWLTHAAENIHFDEDVKGPGQKFFMSEEGELFGVYDPGANLSDPLLQRMLRPGPGY